MGVTTVPGAAGVIGLRVPGVITYRHLAIRLVSTACRMALEAFHGGAAPATEAPEDSDFEAEVVSAFGEAFNNIALHGYDGVPPQPVQIEVDWDDEKLVITSIDTGHAFDPAQVAAPDLDELHEHGMGLFIMRSCMDLIEYQAGPPNVLRLVKLRSRGEAAMPPPAASDGGEPSPTVPPSSGPVYDGPAGSTVGACAPTSTRGSGVQRIPLGMPLGTPLGMRNQESVDRIVESSRRR
jgi:serine/threonine-protein kinase RsbW